jgi:hypothetical protein
MALFSVVLPLAEITFLTPPSSGATVTGMTFSMPILMALLFVTVLVGLLVIRPALRGPLTSRHRARPSRSKPSRRPRHASPTQALTNPILVDGSNVMHWKDERPEILPVQSVIRELKRRGFTPGVVFDANAGYKLAGRYINELEFATLLDLPESQIFVVPKGAQADPYLLDAARSFEARIVTRDRFRDWAEAHPEVRKQGFLIRGGYRDSGEFWLEEAAPSKATNTDAPTAPVP